MFETENGEMVIGMPEPNMAILKSCNAVGFSGFAIRATDSFTIAFDWARVEYSVMAEYFTALDENQRVIGNLFPETLDEATRHLSVDDADEFHIGLEYVFVNASVPIALRFGSFYDPDHKISFQGDPGDDSNLQTLAALFQPGDDQWHYSFGFGFIFGERFQLDAAVDFAETVETVSLSGVLRF